ncbi:SPRY domain-containing SOCS box protein 4-like [Huso huso]|uniref:SPRY domain-containing SOCS box protein 4-like n=1 Tax=Huso huso TaxID=61971 RepID=A0ABR0Y1C1_HUSHU
MGLALMKALRSRLADTPHADPASDFGAMRVSPCLRLETILDSPGVPLQERSRHGWNPSDCSASFTVTADGLTAKRSPVAWSTDSIRGKEGFTAGIHVWEITWPAGQRGSHAAVGVSTAGAALQAPGFSALVGSDGESWGWELGRNELHHGGAKVGTYPLAGLAGSRSPLAVPDAVLVVLDADAGTLGFAVDRHYLGTAFSGLGRGKFHPSVSAVWGDCEIGICYLNGMQRQPQPLMDLCRRVARRSVGPERETATRSLPLPSAVKRFLLYR